jgi:glucose-1-phosphate thymidylyltransferase
MSNRIKGIILAGGTGSRLFPLTRVTNKHLLPVGRKPMIMHCVDKLVDSGISEIMVVTGPEHMGAIVQLLGSGKDFKCHFTYRVQDEAGGIAQALGLCEAFVGNDHCCVILGDNMFTAPLTPYTSRFTETKEGAMILLQRVPDPGRYGVAELSADKKKVVSIVEKPKEPKSDYAVTGIYYYDASVFKIVRTLKPSGRGELEITDVNNDYIRRNSLLWDELPGEWTDAGTFPSLLRANEIMAQAEEKNA